MGTAIISAGTRLVKRSTDKPRYLISDLCIHLESYLEPKQVQEVYRAYLMSAEAHEGQKRISGEPYIYHPVAVARILADMRMDYQCLVAAILHDVIEDTRIDKELIAQAFDTEIAELVDGVSKLTQIKFRTRAEAHAASFRKMMLAMTRDIRVILIKLADRLHNMRTLGALPPKKSRRIARETLEVYAPIANRLGIYRIRTELQDLGLAAYSPMRYRIIKEAVKKARGHRKAVVKNIKAAIRGRLNKAELSGHIEGREKHPYSIYRKMKEKRLPFSEVVDVYAFRIVVDELDSCYRVLGVIHNLYKPVPGRFKDYIAIPKANGYQSLHTVLVGPYGIPIEIQIRTEEMHRMAESGIAAHWIYKCEGDQRGLASATASDWLQKLLELQKTVGDSMEFLEHVKVDLFPEEVYVFTPKGKILVLPRGATVIDFAYAVHSEVGDRCVAACIDKRLVPLRTHLISGQTVDVITAPDAAPNAAWLNFVVTGKARASIRGYLKNLQQKEATALGRRLIEKELEIHGLSLAKVGTSRLKQLLKDFKLKKLNALLREIGLGKKMPLLVARRLLGDKAGSQRDSTDQIDKPAIPLAIKGTEGMVVTLAKCCRPIPGDEIYASFNPGRGIVVHRQECPNLGEFRKNSDSWLDAQWETKPEGIFSTEINIDADNERGVLATVAAEISGLGSNINNVNMKEFDGTTSSLQFVITVSDRQHLARIMRRLRSISPVMRISRKMG